MKKGDLVLNLVPPEQIVSDILGYTVTYFDCIWGILAIGLGLLVVVSVITVAKEVFKDGRRRYRSASSIFRGSHHRNFDFTRWDPLERRYRIKK